MRISASIGQAEALQAFLDDSEGALSDESLAALTAARLYVKKATAPPPEEMEKDAAAGKEDQHLVRGLSESSLRSRAYYFQALPVGSQASSPSNPWWLARGTATCPPAGATSPTSPSRSPSRVAIARPTWAPCC